jgi:hypothetical protein
MSNVWITLTHLVSLLPLDSVQTLGIVTSGNIPEATLTLTRLATIAIAVFLGITAVPVGGQQGQWAAADNSTAKFMVDSERQWAEASCTHNKIAEQILADDFQGTSPDGKRYTKSEELAYTSDPSKADDCRLIDAKVRFFGDNLALVYGGESSIRKAKDGTGNSQCLIWTDTWLKRKDKWQIIAAQDTRFDCK